MVNVAVASGASPTLGSSILKAIAATKEHKAIILTRKVPSENGQHLSVQVDYDSPEHLTEVFISHGIHAVVSVLKILDPKQSLIVHENLIKAAQAANVGRLILSDWSLFPPSWSRVDLLAPKTDLQALAERYMVAAEAACEHVLEICSIQNGAFMEYLVQGCGNPDLLAGLEDDLMLDYIDLANGKLVVPCVSKTPLQPARVTMTSLVDIGRYVVAAIDKPKGSLKGRIGLASITVTFQHIANIMRGLGKELEVTYVDANDCRATTGKLKQKFDAKLSGGDFDVELMKKVMVAQIYGCSCEEIEGGAMISGSALNDLCPEIIPVDLEGFLSRAWET